MNNGIYTDLSIEDYHANTTHLSATNIKIAKRSLKEFDWTRRGLIERKDTSAFGFGNAFELALLSPIEFSEKVAIKNDSEWIAKAMEVKDYDKPRASKTYTELHEKFLDESKGKYVINDTGKESYDTIKHMLESAYADFAIKELLVNTEYQNSIFWTDQESGLNLKTRPDLCRRKNNVVVNVKTIEDGSPAAFSKDLAKYDYPLQACIEIRGCIESGLMPSVDKYFWLVFEKVAPYNATIYDFSEENRRMFDQELQYLLNKLKRAETENKYPGYSQDADNKWGILTANIPLWYKIL